MKHYFEICTEKKIKLKNIPVKFKSKYATNEGYEARLNAYHFRLEEFQTLLYANHARAMLIIFQGMDTSGKDGAIKHVMSGVNPQGCSVISFKKPTSHELEHDFLWRCNQVLPARGKIGIFNRSYYEETLVPRVHPNLLEGENLPEDRCQGEKFWNLRFLDIVNHEKYLHRQGYEIVKIFIHISKNEQKSRLMDRFNDPKKIWKISEGDIQERHYWTEYQSTYEECIGNTATKSSPWYIVPGDDKENARLAISQILVNRFEKMHLDYPKLKIEQKHKLKKLKDQLQEESK